MHIRCFPTPPTCWLTCELFYFTIVCFNAPGPSNGLRYVLAETVTKWIKRTHRNVEKHCGRDQIKPHMASAKNRSPAPHCGSCGHTNIEKLIDPTDDISEAKQRVGFGAWKGSDRVVVGQDTVECCVSALTFSQTWVFHIRGCPHPCLRIS